jgi:hypothetical protein
MYKKDVRNLDDMIIALKSKKALLETEVKLMIKTDSIENKAIEIERAKFHKNKRLQQAIHLQKEVKVQLDTCRSCFLEKLEYLKHIDHRQQLQKKLYNELAIFNKENRINLNHYEYMKNPIQQTIEMLDYLKKDGVFKPTPKIPGHAKQNPRGSSDNGSSSGAMDFVVGERQPRRRASQKEKSSAFMMVGGPNRAKSNMRSVSPQPDVAETPVRNVKFSSKPASRRESKHAKSNHKNSKSDLRKPTPKIPNPHYSSTKPTEKKNPRMDYNPNSTQKKKIPAIASEKNNPHKGSPVGHPRAQSGVLENRALNGEIGMYQIQEEEVRLGQSWITGKSGITEGKSRKPADKENVRKSTLGVTEVIIGEGDLDKRDFLDLLNAEKDFVGSSEEMPLGELDGRAGDDGEKSITPSQINGEKVSIKMKFDKMYNEAIADPSPSDRNRKSI